MSDVKHTLAQVARYIARIVPDKQFIQTDWFLRFGKPLDLGNPLTFNEKLQWLKLYNHQPEYTIMADKYRAREWIAEHLTEIENLEQYLPQLYGVYKSFDEIDLKSLPRSFVLKTNHDSGGVILVQDKDRLDISAARRLLTKALKRNFYWNAREWVYKNIVPCIIAEEYLGDNLNDYKLFAFDGVVRAIQVDYDRHTNHRRNLYTLDWNYIPVSICYPTDKQVVIPKPESLGKMIEFASILSAGIPHLRVDFYEVGGRPIIGELTFLHGRGLEKFEPSDYGRVFGDWITLPERKIK
jgi:hypothetical protein